MFTLSLNQPQKHPSHPYILKEKVYTIQPPHPSYTLAFKDPEFKNSNFNLHTLPHLNFQFFTHIVYTETEREREREREREISYPYIIHPYIIERKVYNPTTSSIVYSLQRSRIQKFKFAHIATFEFSISHTHCIQRDRERERERFHIYIQSLTQYNIHTHKESVLIYIYIVLIDRVLLK